MITDDMDDATKAKCVQLGDTIIDLMDASGISLNHEYTVLAGLCASTIMGDLMAKHPEAKNNIVARGVLSIAPLSMLFQRITDALNQMLNTDPPTEEELAHYDATHPKRPTQ